MQRNSETYLLLFFVIFWTFW